MTRTTLSVFALTLSGLLAVGCGSSGSKSSGSAAAPVASNTNTAPTTTNTVGGTPTPAPAPPPTSTGGLPVAAVLTDVGAPPGGLPVTSDLIEFDNRLWMAQSRDPLALSGAQIWTYDESGNFTMLRDDVTSQGYLRVRVINNQLYVADADPNGLAPGIIYIYDNATLAPRVTQVDRAVHNFDVVQFGNEIFTTGGLDDGSSGLSRFDPVTSTWQVVSTGPWFRIKYAAAFDGAIWATKSATGATDADLVRIDPVTFAQGGVSLVAGEEGIVVAFEEIEGNVYTTVTTPVGTAHARLEPNGGLTDLTGFDQAVMFDFVKHSDGNVYALGFDVTRSLVYGSTDGVAFTLIAEAADTRFHPVSNNADGRPSLTTFKGKLFLAASNGGRLYRLD